MSSDLAYNRRRGKLITAGRWNPWADPGPVRARVELFRSYGASWEAIGKATGVGHMTIWALMNGKDRIRHATARRILSVSPADLGLTRIPAGGAMWRLRSLVAMGHSLARVARALGLDADALSRVLNGDNATINVCLAARIEQLWSAWWDRRPPVRNGHERAAATKARTRAAAENWPCPAALDEDELDLPGYRPRHGWRPAAGVAVAEDYPLGRPEEAA
jgi:transcriptional regulator with XRE-family HTH domain